MKNYASSNKKTYDELQSILKKLSENTRDMYERLRNERQLTTEDVCNSCYLAKTAFYKSFDYKKTPTKKMMLTVAIGLKLSYADTITFLNTAGYTLSSSIKYDLIVAYFIKKQIYDVFEINSAIKKYIVDISSDKLLGTQELRKL